MYAGKFNLIEKDIEGWKLLVPKSYALATNFNSRNRKICWNNCINYIHYNLL